MWKCGYERETMIMTDYFHVHKTVEREMNFSTYAQGA